MDNKKKAWVVTVNMGYGHQRTAYPLKKFAFEQKVINVNDYQEIPEKDKKVWETTRGFYESISRFKRVPLIGNMAFSIFDKFQKIPTFYPHRDLSKPTFSLKKIFSTIKKGWGRDLILKLKKNPLPLITTFFTPAFMAEVFNYPEDIFCVVCDADISRAWVSLEPAKSKIKYFAPNSWVVNRLKLYGVKEENIFLTGFPLPIENIGTEKQEILKKDLAYRVLNLDPQGRFYRKYKPLVDKYIGALPKNSDHPLTVMFSIGGAGAQKEIVIEYVKSLAEKIREERIRIILSAGIRENVKEYFLENIKKLGLENKLDRTIDPHTKRGQPASGGKIDEVSPRSGVGVEIVFSEKIENYFETFNQKLRKTDILWTKPSELSFYTGLGIPTIIAPSIGSQEDFNRKWLRAIGAGVLQENPRYANQWIFDYLNSGRFAEAALDGFIEVEKMGTYNIKKICFG